METTSWLSGGSFSNLNKLDQKTREAVLNRHPITNDDHRTEEVAKKILTNKYEEGKIAGGSNFGAEMVAKTLALTIRKQLEGISQQEERVNKLRSELAPLERQLNELNMVRVQHGKAVFGFQDEEFYSPHFRPADSQAEIITKQRNSLQSKLDLAQASLGLLKKIHGETQKSYEGSLKPHEPGNENLLAQFN
jgi:hypothetical protein